MVNQDKAMEARLKTLEEQIDFLQNRMLEQSYKIAILALYVANTPCCTTEKYAQLTAEGSGATGITEPEFIREARRHGKGSAC